MATEKLKSIGILASMDRTFSSRTMTHHAAPHGMVTVPYDNATASLVCDIALCRKILLSKSFAALNYFAPGMRRLVENGRDVAMLDQFYASVLLFKEGKVHHEEKARSVRVLDQLEADLAMLTPQIEAYFRKRKALLCSPLDFALAFVRLTTGLIVSRLTRCTLKDALAATALRRNVFLYFFQPGRHVASNAALKRLYVKHPMPGPDDPAWIAHVLAQSMIVMGMDPMVGSICASLARGKQGEMSEDVLHVNPTSFVARICTAPVVIGDKSFVPGDVCYLSLLPSRDELESGAAERHGSLAFGLGVHMCIGKRLSLNLFALADEIVAKVFNGHFPLGMVQGSEGAFLVFSPPSDPASSRQ